MPRQAVWVMIPARGGSRGVPRKNVRLLGGLPLLCHSIRSVLRIVSPKNVIVITDDDEIAAIADAEGVGVLREQETTGRATLDDVSLKVAEELLARGASPSDVFLTVQPTCPFIKPERVTEAMAAFEAGAGCVITVSDDRHLGWRLGSNGTPVPDYAARVNRQLLPPQFRESGAIIGCRLQDLLERKTRIVEPIRLIEVEKEEALDIDSFADWAVAEHFVSRRKVVIRADAAPQLGMGHVYRAVAIAQEFARHSVTLATDRSLELGVRLLSRFPFDLLEVDGEAGFLCELDRLEPDLVILDQLNTSEHYVCEVKKRARAVVTFEDLGPGAIVADLVVSDLYENPDVPAERQLTGVENAILAPQFESLPVPTAFRPSVETVLVVFGGTDPSCLTERTLEALALAKFGGRVLVVAGPGLQRGLDLDAYGLKGEVLRDVGYMPSLMRQADLAVSSAGRTITELISCAVPVLCMCQNDKELTHTHASARFGVINLGLGALIGVETLAAHVSRLIESTELRSILRQRAIRETAGRSNQAIIRRMIERLNFEKAPR